MLWARADTDGLFTSMPGSSELVVTAHRQQPGSSSSGPLGLDPSGPPSGIRAPNTPGRYDIGDASERSPLSIAVDCPRFRASIQDSRGLVSSAQRGDRPLHRIPEMGKPTDPRKPLW